MGTSINITPINDITLAIALPSYWSRITAMEATLGPETPKACITRPSSKVSMDGAK